MSSTCLQCESINTQNVVSTQMPPAACAFCLELMTFARVGWTCNSDTCDADTLSHHRVEDVDRPYPGAKPMIYIPLVDLPFCVDCGGHLSVDTRTRSFTYTSIDNGQYMGKTYCNVRTLISQPSASSRVFRRSCGTSGSNSLVTSGRSGSSGGGQRVRDTNVAGPYGRRPLNRDLGRTELL